MQQDVSFSLKAPVLIRSGVRGYFSTLGFFKKMYNTWDRFITQRTSHATCVAEKGWGSKGEQKRHLNLRALVKQRRRSGSELGMLRQPDSSHSITKVTGS